MSVSLKKGEDRRSEKGEGELKVSGTFSLTNAISGRVGKSKIGSCESGEWFFTCAFLFATSSSYEGDEKRTTAKNKGAGINI